MYNRKVRFDYGVPKKCVFGRHWSKPFGGRSGFIERGIARDKLWGYEQVVWVATGDDESMRLEERLERWGLVREEVVEVTVKVVGSWICRE